MRVCIVDPSPLARNIYRLILRRIAECRISEAEDAQSMDALTDPKVRCDLVIVGEQAFRHEAGKLRALLTDVTYWQHAPKLVIAMQQTGGRKTAWDGLQRMTVLMRPFHPAEFEKAVKQCMKERGIERLATSD